MICIYIPYGSNCLLRKYLGYDLGGQVPSQTVFGSIGYIYIKSSWSKRKQLSKLFFYSQLSKLFFVPKSQMAQKGDCILCIHYMTLHGIALHFLYRVCSVREKNNLTTCVHIIYIYIYIKKISDISDI